MTDIQNTLFRMIKLRSPEQISEAQRTKFFITHPNPENSGLFAENVEDFKQQTQDFRGDEAAVLKAMNPALLDFGFWLLKNRTSISIAEAQQQASTVQTELEDTALLRVWDNFIVQCFNFTDFQAKESAMALIYADFILKNFRGDEDAKTFRRLLKSQIVLDTAFWFQVLNSTNPASNQDHITTQTQQSFDEGLKAVESQIYQEEFEQVLEDLDRAEVSYNRAEQKLADSYNKTYNASVAQLIRDNGGQLSATTVMMGETSQRVPIEYPTYDYEATPAMEESQVSSFVSTRGNALLNQIKAYDTDSFAEAKGLVQAEMQKRVQNVFKVKNTEEKVVAIGGAVISDRLFNNILDNYAYKICPNMIGQSLSFSFAVKLPSLKNYFTDIEYRLYQNDSLKEASENVHWSMTPKGEHLTPLFRQGINISGTGLRIEVDLTTNQQEKFTINKTINLNNCVSGKLETPSTEEPEPEPEPTSIVEDGGVRKYGLTRMGIADYQKVEQSICCYAPGEVSHIENIMARELKERRTTKKRSEENTVTTETEVETEKLNDTTSTERFEMNKEISSLLSESKDFALDAGIQYSSKAFGGTISGSVNSSFAYHNSKEESNQLSTNQAKELTERALERIVEKKREERITKIIEEYSESNIHAFDNRQGDSHISGVYRWVDKIYKNEIRNYGKRLIYEFMIPEPARFHLISLQNKPIEIKELAKPRDPRKEGLRNYGQVSEYTAKQWASRYNVDIEPAPTKYVWAGKSFSKSEANGDGGNDNNKSVSDVIQIPQGYALDSTHVNFVAAHWGGTLTCTVANYSATFRAGTNNDDMYTKRKITHFFSGMTTQAYQNEVPVVATFEYSWLGSINANIKFKRTPEHYQAWQIDTFNKIISAYEEKLRVYEEALEVAKTQEQSQRRTNPLFYREIEQMVLRKNCISYMMENVRVGQNFQEGTGSLKTHNIIQNPALDTYAVEVKFIEQAFEWEIMSYQFYPFYWANRERWSELYNQNNEDKMFNKFLQSGMARVMLTIRPGFEKAVMWFMATGQVWEGGNPPVIGDDLYLSIVDELQEPEYTVAGSWESRVPSTLTVIQASSIGLQAEGLPCAEDCTEHQNSGIVQDSTSLANLQVNIEGSNPTSN